MTFWNMRQKLSAKIRILGKGCFCVFREQVARLGYMRMENFWAVIMEAYKWQEELKVSGDLESEIRLVLKGDEGNLSPFEKAGVFGDVFLVSLPEIFLKDVRIDTDYQKGGKLKVAVETDFGRRKEVVQLRVLLTDPENKKNLVCEEWEYTLKMRQ